VTLAHPGHALTHALRQWPEVLERLRDQPLAIFLDYDGTLVPIAPRPELATLPPERRAQLVQLARAWPTTILSGRARRKVAHLVGIPLLNYVGVHGFELGLAYRESVEVHPPIRDVVALATAELEARLHGVPGIIIENKQFAIGIHYRNVDSADVPAVLNTIDEVATHFPELRRTSGKKLRELRPNLDWHKGRALLWVMEQLQMQSALPIFIGDDLTDEDAFQAVADRGMGILVCADPPAATAARYLLHDVTQVYEFLEHVRSLA
jgi:trehalose 6-phosphate phosphatase